MSAKGFILFFLSVFVVSSCSRQKIISKEHAMRVDEKFEILTDDLPLQDFQKGLELHIKLLMRQPDRILNFGPKKMSARDYAWALNRMTNFRDKEKLINFVNKYFVPMEVYGKNEWGEILLTSYYEPLYPARKAPTEEYFQPIYKIPPDLVELDIEKLSNRNLGAIKSHRKTMGGRIINGPGAVPRIIPFYSREEIDNDNKLQKQNLEMYYLDPIHAFFLQIQGSGVL